MPTSTTRARGGAAAVPPPHGGALCGRADLLRALAADRLAPAAQLLGYEPALPPEPPPPKGGPTVEPPRRSPPPAADQGLPLAPSLFWRLEAQVTVEAERDRADERSFRQEAGEEASAPRTPFPDSPPDPEPLGSFAQLLPALRRVAAEGRPGRAPDVQAVLRKVVRGEIPASLPMRKRRRWGRALTVVVDPSTRLIPYRRDFDRVCSGLERLFPDGAIKYRWWDSGVIFPVEGRLVVALTDLGLLSTSRDAATAAWARYGRGLARSRRRPLAILPISPRPGLDVVPPEWDVVGWRRSGDEADDPEEDRRRFAELKALLSPAAQIEPGLARAMRRLVDGAGADLEARLYQSSYLASPHPTVATSDPGARAEAFKAFIAMPADRRRRALDVLRAWRGGSQWAWFTEIMGLDEGTKALLPEGDLEEASQAFLDMCDQMQDGSNPVGALTWFNRQMKERWRPAIEAEGKGRRGAGDAPRRAAWRRAWVRGWDAAFDPSDPRPPGFDLSLLPRSDEPRRRYALRQDGGDILIVPEGEAAAAPGVPLGSIEARRNDFEFEVVSDFCAAGAERGRLVAGGPEARRDLPPGSSFVIRSDCEHLTFGLITRPEWATAIGRDRHGLWARFQVKGARRETVTQRMRWISPGRFRMGSPADEPGRFGDEGPTHEVTISSGFWLFETPTTQALWQAVMRKNPSEFKSPDRPVDSVSRKDCKAFIKAVNSLEGVPELALPTEAEWEYSCRAGRETALYTGSIDIKSRNNVPALHPIAWYGGNSGHEFDLKKGFDSRNWQDKQFEHKQAGTRPVGLKKPNSWGLHDMIGNVEEWCEDGRRNYGEAAVADPVGPMEIGVERVLRGGSWIDDARDCRSAARNWFDPDDRSGIIGFRCVARVQDPETGVSGAPWRGGESGEGRSPRIAPRFGAERAACWTARLDRSGY